MKLVKMNMAVYTAATEATYACLQAMLYDTVWGSAPEDIRISAARLSEEVVPMPNARVSRFGKHSRIIPCTPSGCGIPR